MKHIRSYKIFDSITSKKLLEYDTTKGSLYAYDKRAITVGSEVIEPLKEFLYNCKDCGIEFYSIRNDDVVCKRCESDNVCPVIYE